MQLRFEKPETSDAFKKLAAEHGLVLPITTGDEVGDIVDGSGAVIATVDVNRDLPDQQAEVIAMLVVLAVNTCGGFQAVQPESVDA